MAERKTGEPQLAVRARVGVPDRLVEALRTGTLDIALLYTPPLLPGFAVEAMIEEQLVLVRANFPGNLPPPLSIFMGPAFSARHGAHAASMDETGTFVGFGPLGLAYLLRAGGTGHFRRGMVTPLINEGRLSNRWRARPVFPIRHMQSTSRKRGRDRRSAHPWQSFENCLPLKPTTRAPCNGFHEALNMFSDRHRSKDR